MVFKTVDELDRKITVACYNAYMGDVKETSLEGKRLNELLAIYKEYLVSGKERYKSYLDSVFDVGVKRVSWKKGLTSKRKMIQVGTGRSSQKGGQNTPPSSPSRNPHNLPYQEQRQLLGLVDKTVDALRDKEKQEAYVDAQMEEYRRELRESEERIKEAISRGNEAVLNGIDNLLGKSRNIEKITKKTALEIQETSKKNVKWNSTVGEKLSLAFKNLVYGLVSVPISIAKFLVYNILVEPLYYTVKTLAKPIKFLAGLVYIAIIGFTVYYVYLSVSEDEEWNKLCEEKAEERFLCDPWKRKLIYDAYYYSLYSGGKLAYDIVSTIYTYSFKMAMDATPRALADLKKTILGTIVEYMGQVLSYAGSQIRASIFGY